MKCLECSKEFTAEASFNRHLKAHKLSVAHYHQKYFPRRDLYTGELINFKSKDFYYSNDFNSRSNLQAWFKISSEQERKEYIIRYLKARKESKQLKYTPTQVELKTLMVPGINYLNGLFGCYYKLANSLGFLNKFKDYNLDKSILKDVSNKVIFADKREQRPLDFDLTTRNKSMSYGDYRMAGCKIYIERKSLGDFWGTLTGGYDRFCREIERAQADDSYLVVLIEEDLKEVYNYPHRYQVRGRIHISPEVPLFNMREICQKYNNTQFLFAKDRNEASRLVQTIFSIDQQCRSVDLQFLHDKGELV